ncbi:MAG: ABC transporter permease [Planctomycetaceae bacterium]|nr:ABC transporter permease [Planctomycetaceae bacterium]
MNRFLSDYAMPLVLVLLCAFFSLSTITEQMPTGPTAARQLAERIGNDQRLLIVASARDEDFLAALQSELDERGVEYDAVIGGPREAAVKLRTLSDSESPLDLIAISGSATDWLVFADLERDYPGVGTPVLMSPQAYRWPVFLNRANLLNIGSQISIIAIMAIGMTMVIVTAGIDLSVGSLIAFSAVVCTLFIQEIGGGTSASTLMMLAGVMLAIVSCGLVGAFSGAMATLFRVPPFIVTLAMMLVASGSASLLSGGKSVFQIPDSFTWLGRETTFFGLPNSVTLMLILYAIAHVVMTRTVLGRYLYAVGGNPEAARLSGVPVKRVVLFAYVMSGLLAGVGGVVMASQLKSGSPTYGSMYELYVIAAVVVGGTSLSGGEGKILGTLTGAFIIAVIQNGMNLWKIESFTQKVVLGGVILLAVLLDTLKHRRR